MSSPSAADSLWKDPRYLLLWSSTLISGLGGQIAGLATALLAAVVLQATPAQIGALGAVGAVPAVLLMLPAGVWLDRVRKLPVYIGGELVTAAMLLLIPLAWFSGRLTMDLLYVTTFVGGCVSVVAGTAGQVVLTQLVRREQLVEAHGKNRIAGSIAEIAGPGAAGALVRLAGAPLAIAANALLVLGSVAMLRRLRIEEPLPEPGRARFWLQLKEGVRFVAGERLLLSMALAVGSWQVFQTCAMATQVLFATRVLGLDEFQVGLCVACAGFGTVTAGSLGHRLARRMGSGAALIVGMALSGVGWLQLAFAPAGSESVAAFVIMEFCFGASVVLIFSSMLALRQSITPRPMLARMTSTMRWLTLFPAWPGMLLGGTLAEHYGLRVPFAVGGVGALTLALVLWRASAIRVARVPSA